MYKTSRANVNRQIIGMIANQGHLEICMVISNDLRAWYDNALLPGDKPKDGRLQKLSTNSLLSDDIFLFKSKVRISYIIIKRIMKYS